MSDELEQATIEAYAHDAAILDTRDTVTPVARAMARELLAWRAAFRHGWHSSSADAIDCVQKGQAQGDHALGQVEALHCRALAPELLLDGSIDEQHAGRLIREAFCAIATGKTLMRDDVTAFRKAVDTFKTFTDGEPSPNSVRIVIPTPCTGKNSRRLVRFGDRPALIKSKDALATEQQVRAAIVHACRGFAKPGASMFGKDEVRVTMRHHVERELCEVIVESAGQRPDVKYWRSRDVQNLPDVVLDAMQGVAYDNDNQVAHLSVERVRSAADHADDR